MSKKTSKMVGVRVEALMYPGDLVVGRVVSETASHVKIESYGWTPKRLVTPTRAKNPFSTTETTELRASLESALGEIVLRAWEGKVYLVNKDDASFSKVWDNGQWRDIKGEEYNSVFNADTKGEEVEGFQNLDDN